jgi:hypothetical protein
MLDHADGGERIGILPKHERDRLSGFESEVIEAKMNDEPMSVAQTGIQ